VKIWIDADACPRDIREIVYRASERLEIPVCLVANSYMNFPDSPLISLKVVSKGFDAADDYIADEVSPEDIVITADVPLAARIVERGTIAIDPRGEVFDEENAGERLSVRNLMQELRSGGLVQGGPPQMDALDTHKFASAFDRELTKKRKRS
jgi:hypothetical protein